MSLDKWIKPETKKEQKKKEPEDQKKKPIRKRSKGENKVITRTSDESIEKSSPKYQKYILICPKKKCAYQKTIMKKELSSKDTICPRCKSVMKVKST